VEAPYIDAVLKEWQLYTDVLVARPLIKEIHLGGGTPTFFKPSELKRLIEGIFERADIAEQHEFSFEGHPNNTSKAHLQLLYDLGFRRVSYGVQDFDEKVQKEIHRIQPYEITQNAVKMARQKGIKSINMDLIYGLPYQSLESFKKTLELALTLDPDRLAVFNYAHVPWIKKSMRKFDETTLPNPEVKLEILKFTAEFLTKNGYKMIGMDHFAKPNDELFAALANGTLHRNFQGYTTKGGADLIGIGITSIGECKRHYAQNHKDMDEYEKAIDSGKLPYAKGIYLSDEDLLRKSVIMSLMSNFGLNIKAVEEEFGINFFKHFKNELEELKNLSEFVDISPVKISVNDTGTLIIRNIAMCFDEYLKKIPENLRRFSKTI